MLDFLAIAAVPVIAAATAFVCMDRARWWGGVLLGGLAIGLYNVPVGPDAGAVPWAFLAACGLLIGWAGALVGTGLILDESLVAALVYFGVSTLLFLVWVIAPVGTF